MLKKTVFIFSLLFLLTINSSALSYKDNSELRQYIKDKSIAYGVDEALVCGVIECESGWESEASNYDGSCLGLMQINRVNLSYLSEMLGTDDLYDPYQNVEAGIFMLSGYFEKYDDIDMVLMCYNCGEYGALKLKEQGINETYYSIKVQNAMTKYVENAEECISIDKKFSPMENEETNTTYGVEYRICKE